MFKIGEFSRFTRVSVKTLRHYDEVGLLRPRVVDRFTNYRYYSADQVPRLNQILALRELGFSLEQIGRLLEAELSPDQMRGMFLGKRMEIVTRLREEEAQLGRVDAYLAQLRSEQAAPRYDVVVRQAEPVLVASVRSWVVTKQQSQAGSTNHDPGLSHTEGEKGVHEEADGEDADHEEVDVVASIFDELERYVAQFKARASLPPMILYHDMEYRADGQDLEIAAPLTGEIPAQGRIQIHTLPGCEAMACLIHSGGYEQLALTFATLLEWIELNGFVIAGPLRESFLRFGASQVGYALPESYVTPDADEWVTELQVPIVRAANGRDMDEADTGAADTGAADTGAADTGAADTNGRVGAIIRKQEREA